MANKIGMGGTDGSKHTVGTDGNKTVSSAMKEHRGGALDGNTEGPTMKAPMGAAKEKEWRRSTVGAGQDHSNRKGPGGTSEFASRGGRNTGGNKRGGGR